jgi:hypothetical protein
VPSTAKPRKSSSPRATSSRNGSSATASRASSAASRRKAQESESNGHGIGETIGSVADKARNGAGTIAKGAAAAAVGTAVAAVAGRALIASRKRKRVLGVPMPRRHKSTSVKGVAKQVAGMAEQLEQKSADVSKASERAKQAAKILT